jgi:uncharacterized phage infection (PIP) family protein YhgE
MVNISTNMNKTNNHFSLSPTEHIKKMTYDVANPGSVMGQAQQVAE